MKITLVIAMIVLSLTVTVKSGAATPEEERLIRQLSEMHMAEFISGEVGEAVVRVRAATLCPIDAEAQAALVRYVSQLQNRNRTIEFGGELAIGRGSEVCITATKERMFVPLALIGKLRALN